MNVKLSDQKAEDRAKRILDAADGRWIELMIAATGHPLSLFDGHHHPCPRCGGTDRFFASRRGSSLLTCFGCMGDSPHAGIDAFRWLTAMSVDDAMQYLENYLYIHPIPKSHCSLRFDQLRQANLKRLPQFKNSRGEPAHSKPDGSDWLLSQWSNATLGELGEAANIIKKIERGDFSVDEKRKDLADELADAVTYLDILACQIGIDLGFAVISKFNEVSERVGSDVRLGE